MSDRLILSSTPKTEYTVISNLFIDHYMPQANGTYVKIYLYLLRLFEAATRDNTLATVADALDETEKDIERALRYWESKKLVQLERDREAAVTSIVFLEPAPAQKEQPCASGIEAAVLSPASPGQGAPASSDQKDVASSGGGEALFSGGREAALSGRGETALSGRGEAAFSDRKEALLSGVGSPAAPDASERPLSSAQERPAAAGGRQEISAESARPQNTANPNTAGLCGEPPRHALRKRSLPEKPDYSEAQIDVLTSLGEVQQLLLQLQQVTSRLLKGSDLNFVLYLYESVGFPPDLIVYLYEYCASKNKTNIAYIEKVAIAWAENGIDTVEKAQLESAAYNASYGIVSRAFGLNRAPGNIELKYIYRWTGDYGFDDTIIEEACNRTILATAKPDFKYADRILENWFTAGVRKKEDIALLDARNAQERAKKQTARQEKSEARSQSPQNNRFNAFPQRKYSSSDYSSMEKQLLNSN